MVTSPLGLAEVTLTLDDGILEISSSVWGITEDGLVAVVAVEAEFVVMVTSSVAGAKVVTEAEGTRVVLLLVTAFKPVLPELEDGDGVSPVDTPLLPSNPLSPDTRCCLEGSVDAASVTGGRLRSSVTVSGEVRSSESVHEKRSSVTGDMMGLSVSEANGDPASTETSCCLEASVDETSVAGKWTRSSVLGDIVASSLITSERSSVTGSTIEEGEMSCSVTVEDAGSSYTGEVVGKTGGVARVVETEASDSFLESSFGEDGSLTSKTLSGTKTIFHSHFNPHPIPDSSKGGTFTTGFSSSASVRLVVASLVAGLTVAFSSRDMLYGLHWPVSTS